MKRMCSLLLAVLAVLSLCACQPQSPPESLLPEVSPAPGTSVPESIPPESERVPVLESSSVPEAPIPQEEPEPAPEETPEPKLVASPGVEVKTLLTWNREEKEIALGPCFWGKKQIVYETEGVARRALGLDLETGELDFTIPLPEDYYLREVLGEPGRFLVMGKTGCRNYIWREDGWLGRYPDYILPEQAQKAMEYYDLQYCHFLWDYLPEENLLAWTQGDGIWLAKMDGSDARLAIPSKEVFDRPEFDWDKQDSYTAKYFDLPNPNTDTGPLLVEPRLMNNGKILAASAYFYCPLLEANGNVNGLEILDIAIGERTWYPKEKINTPLEFLDKKTLVLESQKINVVEKTAQLFPLEHWYEWPSGHGYSADGVHFFGTMYGGLIGYTWDGKDEFYFPYAEYEKEQIPMLLSIKEGWISLSRPVDSRRVLCTYRKGGWSGAEETLLLVTAPETAQ